jgi:lipopolysaccharide exporter
MTVAEEGLPAEGTVAEGAAAGVAVAPQRRATSFAGDVLKLVSGTTLAQAIGVLITPILARMYAPEAFGTLALFTSITGILGVVACLRYELAIMLPETDEEAANLLAVSLVAVVAITALTIPVITLGRPLLVRLLKAPELGPYLWLVPIAVFFGGVFQALNYWNSRTKQFGRLSVVRVVQSASTHAVKLVSGLAGYVGGTPLIGATVLGSALSTGVLARRVWRDDNKLFRGAMHWRRMGDGAARYKRFPLIDAWGALLNTISWQLPALMLSFYFSRTVVGYYSLGLRVLQLPMSLIGGAIGQVFFQRAAEAHVQDRVQQTVESTLQQLLMIGLFPLLTLAICGRSVFSLVFGPSWTEAGLYCQILAPWILFWFVSSPLSIVFSVLERQDFLFRMNVVILATRFLSLLIGGVLDNVHIGLVVFSATGTIVYGYLILAAVRSVGSSVRRLSPSIVGHRYAYLLLGLPLAAVLIGVSDGVVAASGAGVCCLYYLGVLRRSPTLRARIEVMMPR